MRRTLGCPDETLICQIGVCNNYLVDCVMRRFREVKHGRMVQLARDMTSAANAVAEARKKPSSDRYERGAQRMRRKLGPNRDPDDEARAAQRLADEEESIARSTI